MSPDIGSVLSNRYTLTEPIATGGMGEVWAATDSVLDRIVAVKLLRPALSMDSSFVERFRAEARHSAALHHPNITTVFDYGEDEGSAYLVMELVPGQPLSQIISERAPLSAQEMSSILIQAANALEAAHQGGVVHRDVKPANILVTPDGTAKLTDFGISRLVNAVPLTLTGQVLGTAQYLSPEQALGESATAASDIYALGVVGHEMLTGQRPFDRETVVATTLAHVTEPSPTLPETVPVGIRTVISAALAKDPADRPASAAAMAQALRMPDVAFASGIRKGSAAGVVGLPTVASRAMTLPARTQAMSAKSRPAEPPGIPDGPTRRRQALVWVAVAAVMALGVFTAFALVDSHGSLATEKPVAPAATLTTPSTSAPSTTPTPAPAETPTQIPTEAPSSPQPATSSTDAPAVVDPPSVAVPDPGQANNGLGKGRDKGDGHDGNNKDGQ
jgi:serine/threonine-protein kinase